MFNKINNIRERKITGHFKSLEAIVRYIKNPERPEVQSILKAREIGKGSEEYRQIKTSSVPCVPINFNHDGYVKSSTITNPTGYMYLDIDDEDSLGGMDLNYVAAYWKSMSSTGYSVVVKSSGLCTENLKEAYAQIGSILGIKYDRAAISKDRLTVLSYDEGAYYNTDYIEIQIEQRKETHFNRVKDTLSPGSNCNGSKIQYDNLEAAITSRNNEIIYDNNGLYDLGPKEKITYSKIEVPFHNVKKGKRNKIMSSIIHQIITLNPEYDKKALLKFAHYINKNKMEPPLPSKIIITKFNYKYAHKNKLKPITNVSRRFLYNPKLNLPAKDKRALAVKKIGNDKVERTKAKIKNALSEWDYVGMGKITNKKVAEVTSLNIKTVNKYCTSIKKEIGLEQKETPKWK